MCYICMKIGYNHLIQFYEQLLRNYKIYSMKFCETVCAIRPANTFILYCHTVYIPIINMSFLLISFFICICFGYFHYLFEWSQNGKSACVYRNDANIEFEYLNIILYDEFGGKTIMRILYTLTQYSTPLWYYCRMALPHIHHCCSFGNKSIK